MGVLGLPTRLLANDAQTAVDKTESQLRAERSIGHLVSLCSASRKSTSSGACQATLLVPPRIESSAVRACFRPKTKTRQSAQQLFISSVVVICHSLGSRLRCRTRT